MASSGQEHCLRFSLAEIKSATNKFSDENVIGKGGYGKVYKGCLIKNSALVAVKRLDKSSEQGPSEFATEIETLSKIRHRNVVSLIGYCNDKREMIVVYEFIANLTLADHLHKRSINGLPSLTWNERLRILIGAARGLDHLHRGCPGLSIVHRDVKSSNILLDEDLVAKVSDFGGWPSL